MIQAKGRRRTLCRVADIPDGGARGFEPAPGGLTGLFAIRRGDAVHVYVNACPHLGISLDWAPDKFLTADGSLIICSTHGAEFQIEDGYCLRGPCHGLSLEAVETWITDGTIEIPSDAGL
jgi:nitrite reductase/ring-hydroxylating ferredoxin subunit